MNRWNAHATANPMMQCYELYLWQPIVNNANVPGSWFERVIDKEVHHPFMRDDSGGFVPESQYSPHVLLLPEGYAEPLRDALDVALGKPRDDYRARYDEASNALIVERQRVDSVLDAGLKRTASE